MSGEHDVDFLRAVSNRKVVFTYGLFAFNILIFILMELAGGTTNEATLLAFGVKSNPEIDAGEIWRLVTPIFIHIGLIHLFFNSYALWIVGPQVEKLYGGSRFFILWVLTGIAGVAGSYWYNPFTISAGASGAIFGLFGILVSFGFKYRDTIPEEFRRAIVRGVLPIIVINLIIGFSLPMIDNAAHLAGLIAGAALALVIPFQQPGTATPPSFDTARTALLIVVAASFYQVVAHYDGPSLSVRNFSRGWTQLLGSRSSTQEFVDTINSAQQTLDDSIRILPNAGPNEIAELETALAQSLDRLTQIPSITPAADQISQGLLDLTRSQHELVQDIQRARTMTFNHSLRADANARQYDALARRFADWVEREGREHGIQLRKQP